MAASGSSDAHARRARADAPDSPAEPPAAHRLAVSLLQSAGELAALPGPNAVCVTPFWFRLFVAGLVALASVLVAFALTQAVLGTNSATGTWGGTLRLLAGSGLAMLLCAIAFRFRNPLDRAGSLRFALTRDGLCLPGRGRRLVVVPWSAVVAVDVERWYGKGTHSAARLTLDLGDECWARFARGTRIDGTGRRRRILIQVVGLTGDEIAARIAACRAEMTGQRG